MKRIVFKKSIVYVVCLMLVCGVLTSLYLIKKDYKKDKVQPVSEIMEDVSVPVLQKDLSIVRPYTDSDVSILNDYYNYNDVLEKQLNSIIFYDKTYMQNTGIIYGKDQVFDVISIADGKVIKIDENDIAGKIIVIEHENDIISTYKLLSEVNVSVNSEIKKGDKLGISGISNLVDNNKYQLHFELTIHGKHVNAEEYYGKNINEL